MPNLEALAAMDDPEHATGETLEEHRKRQISLGWNWDTSDWDRADLTTKSNQPPSGGFS